MAYVKQVWEDGVTLCDEEHMNHIEEGIETTSNNVETNTQNIASNTNYITEVNNKIGTLSDLTTTAKDNLVNAINEIDNIVSDGNVYSTTEQIVGKWIDGKNIYRKVITTTEALNANTVTINHNIENFEHVVRCYGYLPYGTSQYLFGAQEGTTYASIASVDPTSIKVKIGSSWLNSFTEGCVIIIEYTKTTDTATINNDRTS